MPVQAQAGQYDSGFSYKPSQVDGSDTQQHNEDGEVPLENKEKLYYTSKMREKSDHCGTCQAKVF